MRGCSSLPIKKKSRGTGCIADLVAAYGLTQPAGGGKILFTIPMKSSWLSMAPWNLRLAVESTIQSLARNCLFRRVSCTPYAILDARPPTGCTDIGDDGFPNLSTILKLVQLFAYGLKRLRQGFGIFL